MSEVFYLIIIILFLIIIFLFLIEIFNRLFYKKTVGIVGLKRNGKTIVMIFSIFQVVRYYTSNDKDKMLYEDFENFFNSLENGIYETKTHRIVLGMILNNAGKQNILNLKYKERSMILEYLLIGKVKKAFKKVSKKDSKKVFKKYQFYDVHFLIEDKK